MAHDDREARWQRRFDVPVTLAVLLIIPVLLLDTSGPDQPWRTLAEIGDWFIWLTFASEMVVMLAVTRDRRRWLAEHPLDVAVVVLTPPFAEAILQSLRLVRILRLVRLLRVAYLARSVFSLAGLRWITLLAVLVTVTGASAFSHAEGEPFDTSLYWAFTTMTTVGYGDVAAVTGVGQAVSVLVMLVGSAFFAVLTGAVVHRFMADAEEPPAATQDLKERLERIEDALARLASERER